MNKEELYENIDTQESFFERYLGLSFTKFFILLTLVLLIGIYIGIILYGTNSLEILVGLNDYSVYLEEEIDSLKKENAQLQREYFELKEISAQ